VSGQHDKIEDKDIPPGYMTKEELNTKARNLIRKVVER
jgi:hypothetical protein